MYKIAFVGNPNVGKSTWINYLSGSNLKVANYLGVSVEASIVDYTHKGKAIQFVDLPGVYDLHHVSAEETYTKQYLDENKIDLIVNVIDYRDVKRQLHLTNQLKQLNVKMMIILNFIPETISTKKIESFSNYLKLPIIYSGFNNRESIIDLFLRNKVSNTQIINERDFDQLHLHKVHKEYAFDEVLLHPLYGIPLMLFILISSVAILYSLSQPIADGLNYALQMGYDQLLSSVHIPIYVESIVMLCLTLFQSMLGFIPFLFFIFVLLSIIEESGYVARIAYLMDPFMSIFHLSGKSVIPLFIGFGCNVPAIMATRMLDNKKERIVCALMIPFISCSAKLPIFLLFTGVFFPEMELLVLLFLYSLSILVSLLVGSVLNRAHKEVFVLELPSYQFPVFRVIMKKSIHELEGFIKKVFFVLLLSIIFVFVIQFLFQQFHLSLLFAPLSFMENDIVRSSTIYGLLSKENLLFYYAQLAQGDIDTFVSTLFSNPLQRLKVLCYLMYIAMNIPCIMTLVAIKKEFGKKVLVTSIVLMLVVPYILTFIAYQGFSLWYL